MDPIVNILIQFVIKIAVILGIVFTAAALGVYVERKVAAFIQLRIGPNRVGPFGILQPFADVLKLLMKEDITPSAANKPIHRLAPILTLAVTFIVYAVIPFSDFFYLNGEKIYMGIATSPNINVGMLFILAMTGISVYGLVLAGWSSNNKYSLMGGIRSSAQLISYELSMGMALVAIFLMSGSFGLSDIVNMQAGWKWNILLNPLGFIIFITAAFAETNRAPFDLPEAEPELVSGYNTEYSGMKFGMFFLAEYANMFTASVLISLIYLGGWHLPFMPELLGLEQGSFLLAALQVLVVLIKTSLVCFFFIWARWSLPRMKYNMLMNLGWKVFLPLGLLNIVLTAIGVYIFK